MREQSREQIRELKSQHAGEVGKLKADYEKRIEDQQHESAERLNAKDMQHQKEIENLKAMHQRRLAEIKRQD